MLSLAVALLGSPPVLMLDEPSSGICPSLSVITYLSFVGSVIRDQIAARVICGRG